ncbi:hypothetical protein KSP39_PZI022041 [Platanthera zijinensis]|uniref:Uncharacterized protein n=1 Tax=Platanthera zijinensis TaxID=2320716 RepID=A0AAP0AYG5_9ASPA
MTSYKKKKKRGGGGLIGPPGPLAPRGAGRQRERKEKVSPCSREWQRLASSPPWARSAGNSRRGERQPPLAAKDLEDLTSYPSEIKRKRQEEEKKKASFRHEQAYLSKYSIGSVVLRFRACPSSQAHDSPNSKPAILLKLSYRPTIVSYSLAVALPICHRYLPPKNTQPRLQSVMRIRGYSSVEKRGGQEIEIVEDGNDFEAFCTAVQAIGKTNQCLENKTILSWSIWKRERRGRGRCTEKGWQECDVGLGRGGRQVSVLGVVKIWRIVRQGEEILEGMKKEYFQIATMTAANAYWNTISASLILARDLRIPARSEIPQHAVHKFSPNFNHGSNIPMRGNLTVAVSSSSCTACRANPCWVVLRGRSRPSPAAGPPAKSFPGLTVVGA